MADKKTDTPAEDAEQPAPAKSKKLLILIIVAVLVVVLAAGGAFLLLGKKKNAEEGGEEEEAAAEVAKAKKKKDEAPPVFVNLEPFVVNLVPETGDQYLRLAIAVEMEDPKGEGTIKAHMPKIRNAITLLLSSKKASELTPREGKEKLALELKDAINIVLEPPAPPKKPKPGEKPKPPVIEGPVQSVLFTDFIIQ